MRKMDSRKKRVLVYAVVLTLCMALSTLLPPLQPLHSHAATWDEMAENGTVRDGAVGDRPGYIGDERDRQDRNNDTDPHDQNHTGLTGDLDQGNRQAVLGAQDSMPDSAADTTDMTDSAMTTFWWVLAAVVIGAIVLAIVWLLLPKREEE